MKLSLIIFGFRWLATSLMFDFVCVIWCANKISNFHVNNVINANAFTITSHLFAQWQNLLEIGVFNISALSCLVISAKVNLLTSSFDSLPEYFEYNILFLVYLIRVILRLIILLIGIFFRKIEHCSFWIRKISNFNEEWTRTVHAKVEYSIVSGMNENAIEMLKLKLPWWVRKGVFLELKWYKTGQLFCGQTDGFRLCIESGCYCYLANRIVLNNSDIISQWMACSEVP